MTMVSTRNHPKPFSPVVGSPLRTSTSPPLEDSTAEDVSGPRLWSHTPSNLTLIWLCISLPLVIWDTAYVFLRPHSMAGGKYSWPLWTPYELYATVDYVYGLPSYERKDGFTAAQASLNVVETLGYLVYLWILFSYGKQESVKGRGAPSPKTAGWLGQSRALHGTWAAYAVVLLYGLSLMTVSKTVLYWLNEAFSGFASIGHNDTYSLIVLWIIPNGAWIVLPAYMMYVSSLEILQGLELAAGEGKKDR